MSKIGDEDYLAELIPFPGVGIYWTKCCVCELEGQFEAYHIYQSSLANAYFYCNECKHYHPKGYNIDITECPELAGVTAIPKGIIIWSKRH